MNSKESDKTSLVPAELSHSTIPTSSSTEKRYDANWSTNKQIYYVDHPIDTPTHDAEAAENDARQLAEDAEARKRRKQVKDYFPVSDTQLLTSNRNHHRRGAVSEDEMNEDFRNLSYIHVVENMKYIGIF